MRTSRSITATLLALACCLSCNLFRKGSTAPDSSGTVVTATIPSAPAVTDSALTVAATDSPGLPSPAGADPALEVRSGKIRNPSAAETPAGSGEVVVGGVVAFDKTVHDFGDILTSDGPQKCTFTLKNISKEAIAIYEVISSCGCTDAGWTAEPIQSGKTGTISAVYKNEDGAIPFDKTLTVYVSALKKPVILRLRGNVMEKKLPLAEAFPVHFGDIAFKTAEYKIGNLEQGGVRSDRAFIANIGRKAVQLDFKDLPPQLSLSVSPNPIPAGSTATLTFTAKADRQLWGKNYYRATLVENGVPFSGNKLSFWTFTKEDFSSLDDAARAAAPLPYFENSTSEFGTASEGDTVEAVFRFTNKGKSLFHCYKAETDAAGLTVSEVPDVPAGGSGEFKVSLDTKGYPKGEVSIFLTLITNSPSRPIVNLFVSGKLE